MYNALCGSSRRVQALIRRGFTVPQISTASGLRCTTIQQLALSMPPSVSRDDAYRLTVAYSSLELDDPPSGTTQTQIHKLAVAGEWAPPERWAGYDIDDPYVMPPEVLPLTLIDYRIIRDRLRRGELAEVDATLEGREGEIPALAYWLFDKIGMTFAEIGQIMIGDSGTDPRRRGENYVNEYRKHVRIKKERAVPEKALILFTGSRRLGGHHAPGVWRILLGAVHGGQEGAVHAVMEGGCKGGDTIARWVGTQLGWTVMTRPADWHGPCRFDEDADPRCGRGVGHRNKGRDFCPYAGFRRNQQMVNEVAELSAIHNDLYVCCRGVYLQWSSNGTSDCVKRARAAGIKTVSRTLELPRGAKRRRTSQLPCSRETASRTMTPGRGSRVDHE